MRDLEQLKDIATLDLLVDALRERVGRLIVLSNIAGDLQVAPQTIERWLGILEKMYAIFIVNPIRNTHLEPY